MDTQRMIKFSYNIYKYDYYNATDEEKNMKVKSWKHAEKKTEINKPEIDWMHFELHWESKS